MEERTEGDATERSKRPGGSPALLFLALIVVVPAVLLADTFDAGPAAIIGGLVGLFSLIAFMGGPLRADLRIAAVLGPLLLFGAVVPRLVAGASRPAAIALVVLLVLVAALLPALGPRFTNAGIGLGMTTLYAYAYATHGAANHGQVVVAALAGVVVALGARLVLGLADPSKPTREQVAEVLVADDPGAATATAFDVWLSDGRPRWLGTVLSGAARFRLAVRAGQLTAAGPADATEPAVAALRERAADLAEQVRAKRSPADPDDPGDPAGRTDSDESGASGGDLRSAPAALGSAADALDEVARAVRERDATAVLVDRGERRALRRAALSPSAGLRSIQLRHAVRTAFGVLVMLLVTSTLEPGDPLVTSVLLTTFGILQASWRETFDKARAKILGLVGGSAAVAVILLTVPERYLMPVAALSLAVGLWYVTTRPALGGAFMVVVSVGFNAVTRDLDAGDLLVQYALLTACAVAVGLVLGFAVIPAFRPPPLRQRVESAIEATAAVLRARAAEPQPPLPELLALQHDAAQKGAGLVPDRDHLDDQQLGDLDRLREGLHDLGAMVDSSALEAGLLDPRTGAVERAVALLESDGAADAEPGARRTDAGAAALLWSLAEQCNDAARSLLRTLPASG